MRRHSTFVAIELKFLKLNIRTKGEGGKCRMSVDVCLAFFLSKADYSTVRVS